ncbi:MAG: hypothetical protein A2176_00125 [Spirochaetes bacterium RBG_13_51_14]|nr:MAG: hypothetical protein A2176_00125 [Spirochaetes bacterium RBG_13_51_14]
MACSYKEYIRERTLRYGRTAGWLSLVFPVLFLTMDRLLLWYPVNTIPWRLIPTVVGALLLLFSLTPLKKYARVISALYYLFLMSLMAMVCALSALFMKFHIFGNVITGMVIIIFVIHFGSMGGWRYLVPIYALPVTACLVYLVLWENPSKNHILTLSNPLALIILSCIFAEMQERIRHREFSAGKTAESSIAQLKEKNIQIEKNNNLMQEQLELARIIQRNLIPKTVPHMKDLDIHAVYMPMYEIGGDLYDFIHFKEPHLLGVFIADVTGHGVPAALITSMVKTLANMSGREKLTPSSFLSFLNEKIIDMGSLEFISAFYALYDSSSLTLRYGRAGHCTPYLIRGREISELTAKGVLLGVSRGGTFQEREIQLQRNDKIIFYTDGLTEAENMSGIQFSEPLVKDLRDYSGLPISDLVSRVYTHLLDFMGGKKFEDDVCIVGIEVR